VNLIGYGSGLARAKHRQIPIAVDMCVLLTNAVPATPGHFFNKAHAAGPDTQTVFDPTSTSASINDLPEPAPVANPARGMSTPFIKNSVLAMAPAKTTLDPSNASHTVGRDGRLKIDAARAVTARYTGLTLSSRHLARTPSYRGNLTRAGGL
jgi:hypothetical protein